MKTKILKHSFFIAFLLILVACSTKKDTFLARNSHALSTKYNIDYNGQVALDKGIVDINQNANDNFWVMLPIEKMQIVDQSSTEVKTKNANFELAETKATKAIQKHSMNIDGREKNSQMDEAYLLLGKARYYDQRFIPALDAFNYILYKYPNSSNIDQAKIWREKANMRLGNDAQVVKNMSRFLDEKKKSKRKLNKQIIADANALLAASFLNLEEKDSAVAKLKIAEKNTKVNADRARYRFVLGQLYQDLGKKDSAIYSYQSVIAMNRKADRLYVIQAYAKKAQLFDYQNGDKDAFVKKYNKLVDDRENRPYLDVIFYEMGVFYDKQNDQALALEFYNASLKRNSKDSYLIASNYRNMGNMHFRNTEYSLAAKYYDSTLVKMNPKTRECIHIKKIRKDLDEVVEYETIAKEKDSILNVMALSDADKIVYYEKHIDQLKKQDADKKAAEEKLKEKAVDNNRIAMDGNDEPPTGPSPGASAPPSMGNNSGATKANDFYFYNPTTVAFGKTEFRKKYGNRTLGGNWKSANNKSVTENNAEIATDTLTTKPEANKGIQEQYSTEYYLNQLPKNQLAIDEIVKQRNFAYYQLGIIYKEKFKEYGLASQKLEQLLVNNPEEKMVLPTMYNLYKIYQITDSSKAEDMKNRISKQYPDSRYAQIINNLEEISNSKNSPEDVYEKWFKLYQDEKFVEVLTQLDAVIFQYSGDEIVSKFELLKANVTGKLQGLEAYKNALQYVADNYPTTEEGKNAQEILTSQIPSLEKMNFTTTDTNNWKILYSVGSFEDKNTKALEEKIKKFIASENIVRLTYSHDVYTEKINFITVTGFKSEAYAKNISFLLKEDKKYKVTESAVVITNENYKVVQIKKNLHEYTSPKVATTEKGVVPQTTTTPSQTQDPAMTGVPPVSTTPTGNQKTGNTNAIQSKSPPKY